MFLLFILIQTFTLLPPSCFHLIMETLLDSNPRKDVIVVRTPVPSNSSNLPYLPTFPRLDIDSSPSFTSLLPTQNNPFSTS